MADVKWIKLVVNLFDDEKILFIESMPDADSIIIIWIKLLCLAGKQNNKGVIAFNGIPYTAKMLSTIFRRDEAIIATALDIFKKFGMVKIVSGTITIVNWGKHQNLDKIEASNEYMRNYMKTYRAKQKAIITGEEQNKPNNKLTDKLKIRLPDEELKIDKDIDINIDIDEKIDTNINSNIEQKIDSNKNTEVKQDIKIEQDKNSYSTSKNTLSLDYDLIANTYNRICKSLPKVVKLTDGRVAAIDAASEALGDVLFEQLFAKVENSDFLKGLVMDWKADFDWIIQPEHIRKILSGLYDNRKQKTTTNVNYSDPKRYENLKMEV